ncbi:hypothetical protein CKM354_001007500 [Cercospora kikuchii]|uniref:Nephrocystin 3-like N-terminal domain-containing protein n=1 Tax=Cercospora kikuchii TaxID=84275 RepID=A0A9P3CQC6_9PEZI|nr:uncharacterized protein CKM354_001007500 [Cercospora kikuchii]GIZ46973.1 hypothetical protein CKM354_001007500 [Cercospora kikuchii]
MDAISALSVATATVQFLDFSLQALALCRQIRDDAQGSTAVNAQLSAYARDVRNAAQELQRTSTNNTPAGRQIVNVARQCIATSEELTNVLLEVQRTGKPSAFNNAKTTFKAMRGRRTNEKLQNALRAQHERLDSAINHDIRDRVDLAGITQSRQYESIQRQMQQMAFSFDKQQLALQEHQLAILRHGSLLQDRFVADERRSGALSQNLKANHQAVMQRLSGLHDNLNSGFGSITIKDARAKFLGGLFFPELKLRQETFPTPANRTGEWVFQATNSDRFTSLGSWLHTGTAMYWMCGKAGSGKSTLMAHIVGHRQTHFLLSQWATPFSLRVVTFFFWRSGTELQKSLSGMLRSLIYQLVDSVPDILLPLLTQYPLPAQRYPAWSAPRLVELARLAVEQASKAHKLCIFIDGIDEYDGDLAELLQLL